MSADRDDRANDPPKTFSPKSSTKHANSPRPPSEIAPPTTADPRRYRPKLLETGAKARPPARHRSKFWASEYHVRWRSNPGMWHMYGPFKSLGNRVALLKRTYGVEAYGFQHQFDPGLDKYLWAISVRWSNEEEAERVKALAWEEFEARKAAVEKRKTGPFVKEPKESKEDSDD